MIVFSGEVSGKCREYLIKNYKKGNFYSVLFVSVFFVPLLILAVINWGLICLIGLIGLAVMFAFTFLNPSKEVQATLFPTKITINDTEIETEGEKFYHHRPLEDVTKIIDMGEFYQFRFVYPNTSFCFVCQKDLITEGTIEEFEKIFTDKIVKKY